MIFTKITFGRRRPAKNGELEDMAENYITSLFHSGQLCGEYFLTWIKGQLVCHTGMAGLGADELRFHSVHSEAYLKTVIKEFGQAPTWTILDDEVPSRNISWKAPTLSLFTHAFDWESPLSRGDNGKPVPIFLLPLTFQQKNDIIRWQAKYILHDRMWLDSGSLEIAAYKELVQPNSQLSVAGRDICAEIERATKVPTYYFLMRFYAPSQGSDDRPCPGCGKPWRIQQPTNAPFQQWPFRCESCRLVSTVGVDVNKRLAKHGQWVPSVGKMKNSI
jgi:predicted  nucleic acid-binding Zn ribbon protein